MKDVKNRNRTKFYLSETAECAGPETPCAHEGFPICRTYFLSHMRLFNSQSVRHPSQTNDFTHLEEIAHYLKKERLTNINDDILSFQ